MFIDLPSAFYKIQECASPHGFDPHMIYVIFIAAMKFLKASELPFKVKVDL